MDFKFKFDEYDRPVAKFSMVHEAIGQWLSEELRDDLLRIDTLLATVEKLLTFQLSRQEVTGAEFQLRMTQDQIEVIALALDVDTDEDLPEDTHYYDRESYSGCGLLDFKQALLSWKKFVG